MYQQLLDLMAVMLLMMLAGFVLQKAGMVSTEGRKTLVNIILYLLLPCNIIKAFCMELSMSQMKAMWVALAGSLGIQLFYVVLNRFLYNRFPENEKPVYQYATLCSNAGFLGNPLAQGVFGNLGLLYASVFLIPQRVVMWTAGITCFTETSNKKEAARKVLLHPCIIAVEIGLLLLLLQVQLPGPLDQTVSGFSRCCTGMTMLYIGTVLGDVDYRTLASPRQVYFALLRLVLIPAAVWGVFLLLDIDPLVTGVCVLMTAMPAGNTTAILAAKYHAHEEAAVRCVVFTTALSVVTTPVWSFLLTACL
ncbi:MAG: AEC family transporter [Anaerovoracaceae bacterium]